MSVGTVSQNIIILFWKKQFHFWEYIHGNHPFILDSHRSSFAVCTLGDPFSTLFFDTLSFAKVRFIIWPSLVFFKSGSQYSLRFWTLFGFFCIEDFSISSHRCCSAKSAALPRFEPRNYLMAGRRINQLATHSFAPLLVLLISFQITFFFSSFFHLFFLLVGIRETRDRRPLLTVKTEANRDSRSTNEKGPSLVGSLVGSWCRYKRFFYSAQ